jgi:hypothetical protein
MDIDLIVVCGRPLGEFIVSHHSSPVPMLANTLH